jgi:hypothetical protein
MRLVRNDEREPALSIRRKECSRLSGLSVAYFKKEGAKKGKSLGPPLFRIGRSVLYDRIAFLQWLKDYRDKGEVSAPKAR